MTQSELSLILRRVQRAREKGLEPSNELLELLVKEVEKSLEIVSQGPGGRLR